MTILRPSLDTQEIIIIPRRNASEVSVVLINEETQVVNTFNPVEPIYNNGYMYLSFDLTVKEAESFNLEIKDGSTVLFRGKAFATDETDLENYKLSKNLLQ